MLVKRTLLIFSLALIACPTLFAQKFTKREQARRQAREEYYFCGATFTLTAGYVHSWMNYKSISSDNYAAGRSEYWGNTDNSFNLGFAWDQAFNKKWGMQTALYYMRKGGDHLYYYDSDMGYGKILRPEETEEITWQGAELQCQVRYFINLSKHQRVTVNAGVYVDKLVGSPAGMGNWNLGPQVGLGYDWRQLSVSTTYQPGVFQPITSHSHSTQSALMVNLGFRFWKK
jgi:hypothetical protein